MQTRAINISNLCVPCECHCRYCLLSWQNKLLGIDYKRSESYAKRFYDWIKTNNLDLDFMYYFGYSMEHPNLLDAIDFMKSTESAGGEFLQFNGLKFRTKDELKELIQNIIKHGIKKIDLTFYGTKEYHDKFAGRVGDYDYLILILETANEMNLQVDIGIALNHENANQIEGLIKELEKYKIDRIYLFVPHAEGRGHALDSIRFNEEDYKSLGDKSKKYLNTKIFKSEAEWLKNNEFNTLENRVLTIVLTPENIEMFEKMSFEDTIKYIEKLDDEYFMVMPSLEELARLYGDPNNMAYYSQRDLYLKYQRQYIKDHQLNLIYDINDETHCFARRY